MVAPKRDVLVTGVGLLSSLGEGVEAHREALASAGAPRLDGSSFAPYTVHPLVAVDWSAQIPKKGDQRQMETWQKIGVYAAGLALADAAVPADEPTRASVDMIVAAGGGERDTTVDALVLARAREAGDNGARMNATLSSELRPTLFLAQLSNLLAGNISIVHKVTGSSRTFMGEEGAGISALAVAQARIAAGQSDICLVGSAYNAERKDLLLNYEIAGMLRSGPFAPVFERIADGGEPGLVTGSVGAFLVLESAEHAQARGARAYARLTRVEGDRGRRDAAALEKRLSRLVEAAGGLEADIVVSGASGLAEATRIEREVLAAKAPNAELRAAGERLGHSFETQFIAATALAALDLSGGGHARALVTTVGHSDAEGVAALEAVSNGEAAR